MNERSTAMLTPPMLPAVGGASKSHGSARRLMLQRGFSAVGGKMSGAKEAAHVYRSDIDGLRAVAVIPVVLYHANISMPGGFVGVDVFFVISGYLITKIIEEDLEARRFSLLNFYDARIRRIFPALFVMFARLSVVAYLTLPPLEHARFSDDLSSAAIFISNIHFFRQASYFDASAFSKPLLHTWSLGGEQHFYNFRPIFLLFFGASSIKRSKLAWIGPTHLAPDALYTTSGHHYSDTRLH